ncbi:MAG: ArsR family transcriptional regulator [Chloroflexi bacterium]|nr:ArsR family transcriptional regulator [Chloroflexota bacterium]
MSTIRQTILETLNQRGPLCVGEIAQVAQLSKMATRYHLGLLARDNLIVQTKPAHRGCVGRPEKVYALGAGAHEHLPKQYHLLAGQLLDEIADTLGEKETRTLLRRAGKRIAESAPALRAGAGTEARVKRVAKFLAGRGYMADWADEGDTLALVVCNCPFRQVAIEHREVCEMDMTIVGALLETPAKMTRCIANHDAHCRFVMAKI